MRLSRIHLWVFVISLAAMLALLGNQLLRLIWLRESERYMLVVLAVLAYSLVGLCCAAVYDNGRMPRLMRCGIVIGMIALVYTILWVYFPQTIDTIQLQRVMIWGILSAPVIALIGLLSLLPLRTAVHRGLRIMTMTMLIIFAGFIAGAVTFAPLLVDTPGSPIAAEQWISYRAYLEQVTRIGIAMGVLTAAAIIMTVIVGIYDMLAGRKAGDSLHRSGLPFWMECPRCGREQSAATGEYACVACGLKTRVHLT